MTSKSKCPQCPRATRSGAHCGTCHRTFGGVRAFDLHRQGPVSGRVCADPATVGLVERDGVWRQPPMSDDDRTRVEAR
jgi:hypothetical protein